MIVSLTGVAHGGYAVGRHDGKVYFVSGGIPGETVEVEITRESKRFSFARVLDVRDASPDRVAHVWPEAEEFGVGGADLGHVEIGAQRRWKGHVISDALERIGGGAVLEEVRGAVGTIQVQAFSDGTGGTRTRASFVVDDERRLAMRRAGTHETVAVSQMPLALQEIDALNLFSGAWSGQLEPGGTVKAVLPSDGVPVLHTDDGVWLAPAVPAPSFVAESVLCAAGEYHFRLDAGGFWQTHVEAPATLLDAVIEGASLRGNERVLELYAGAGLFTLPLAQRAGYVTAIEGTRRAHEDARENVRTRNVTLRKSSVTPRALEGEWDVVVLDPPREGAGLTVTRALAGSGARRIVYVACDPVAMARDLAALIGDYAVESFAALDLFEHTHHVECVAVLARR
ncbi:MAG: TRAM domain-containing protein [Ruaniaceae bacterium]|nr:TRAM domain-containing protein [Ruaniaceae bacterium]